MALRKKTEEPKIEETKEETTEAVEEVTPIKENGLTPEENVVLSDSGKEVSVANSKKLELAMELLAHQFNIDESFYLTKSQDKGNKMTLGFSNTDYNVTIEIKNVEEMGFNCV